MGIITVTERQVYKRCPKRWDYSSHSRQNLEPIITPTALSLGRIIHEAHEKWIQEPDTDPVEFVMQSGAQELETMKRRYKAAVGAPISEEELGSFYDSIELARTMISNYRDFHRTPLPSNFELVGVEQRAIVPIPNSNCANCGHTHSDHLVTTGNKYWCVPDSKVADHTYCECVGYEPHYLEGTFDGIIRGPDGRVWVLERKTYRARPKLDALNTNDQFLAYAWVLQKLDLGPVGGVAYDGMWKRGVSENQTRKNAVKLQDLFLRTLLTRPQYEIDQFEKYLTEEANLLCGDDTPIYLNRRWEGCYDCPMDRLCAAEHRGEDAEYVRDTFYAQRSDTGSLRGLGTGDEDDE